MSCYSETKNIVAGYRAVGICAVVALFVLCSSLACFAGTPGHETHSAASSPAAIPQPTPPDKPLDQDAVSALIDDLQASLGDAIDDEDVIASIGDKWAARDLAGKTRSQILAILFTDVKSVVKDQKTLDKIWASWKDNGDEMESETPPVKPETPPATPAPQATPIVTTDTPTMNPETPQTPPTPQATPIPEESTEGMIEFDPPPLSDPEMNEVMKWIAVRTSALRLPFCWRDSYGNTAGEPYTCKAGLNRDGLLCYPPCQPGFHKSTANLCTTDCPAGFTDIGAFCQKPGPYGRGAGYPPGMPARFSYQKSQPPDGPCKAAGIKNANSGGLFGIQNANRAFTM